MADNYADRDLDLSVSASPPLGRPARRALVLLGLLLLPAAPVIGFVAIVVAGGGHGSPFNGGAAEFVFGLATWAIPILLIVLGIGCLTCTNRWRLRLVVGFAAALAMDLGLAVVALRLSYT